MITRPIPSTREPLPVVGLGTYQVLDVGGDAQQQEPLKAVLRALVNHGGSVIDSSPMYGTSESVAGDLSQALGLRAKLFMATKVWTSGRESGVQQMQDSMRKMRVDKMDLMQVHNLLDWETHLKTLMQWKSEGKVRYLGVTHYTESAYAELERVMRKHRWDFAQFNFSLAEPAAEERLLRVAADLGIAVIINRPFAAGSMFSRTKGKPLPEWVAEFDCTSWAQFFLKWILGNNAVTCVIPASRKEEHAVDNCMAGVGRLPDAQQRAKMAACFNAL